MAIPSELIALISPLNQELDEIDRQATAGQNLVRSNLPRLPENVILRESYTYLNNVLQFVDDFRSTIQSEIESISGDNETTDTEIRRVGEDLAAVLGVALEIKIQVGRIFSQLENLL